MQIQAIQRDGVHLALKTARLPLTVLEAMSGRSGDPAWPPTLAYDAFEANIKQIVGSLARNHDLVEEARLEQAKVAELRESLRLEAQARQRETEADREYQQRQKAAQEKRSDAEQRADARKHDAEAQARKQEAAVERELREKERAADEAKAAREKQLAKQERSARAESITKERQAIQHEKVATKAKAEVIDLDAQLRESKAARKSS